MYTEYFISNEYKNTAEKVLARYGVADYCFEKFMSGNYRLSFEDTQSRINLIDKSFLKMFK